MSSASRSRSRRGISGTTRRFALVLIALFALASVSLTTLASLVTTDQYIVTSGDVVNENVYVSSVRSTIEGVIDGDLTIFTGDLTITGEVKGSVTVLSSGSVVVAESGTIGGALDGAAVSVRIDGTVRGDVFIAAPSIVVTSTGRIGRDAMLFGGTGRVEGIVDRDVRGRTWRLVVDGEVGGDVDVATQKLEFGPDAVVSGDVLYRSSDEAKGAENASIAGTITRLPAQSNFVFGIILALANIVGFFGFIVASIVTMWVLRGTSARATGKVLTQPFRSLGVGVATVIVLPLAIGILAVTLVGIPLAALGVLLAAAFFIVGPLPAVTAFGNRVLLGRGGLFGALLAGAIVWRLGIWLIPVVGGLIYVIAMVWGIGGWVLSAIATRKRKTSTVQSQPSDPGSDAQGAPLEAGGPTIEGQAEADSETESGSE